ncbi:Hypothetical predicted protein [Octopus vulgaris]|uniref:Uncharacterized protein n=1 Tax=Octopus vulgaris TaxID=6645 RepID=A0AA36B416_OCTVU|nr:Hypothetical predicted protein [Octopus vulgaris]
MDVEMMIVVGSGNGCFDFGCGGVDCYGCCGNDSGGTELVVDGRSKSSLGDYSLMKALSYESIDPVAHYSGSNVNVNTLSSP